MLRYKFGLWIINLNRPHHDLPWYKKNPCTLLLLSSFQFLWRGNSSTSPPTSPQKQKSPTSHHPCTTAYRCEHRKMLWKFYKKYILRETARPKTIIHPYSIAEKKYVSFIQTAPRGDKIKLRHNTRHCGLYNATHLLVLCAFNLLKCYSFSRSFCENQPCDFVPYSKMVGKEKFQSVWSKLITDTDIHWNRLSDTPKSASIS